MIKIIIASFTIFTSSVLADSTYVVPKWAQEKKPFKISYYAGLGTSFPTSDFADGWKQGIHGFGRLDFSASPKLSVWAGADFHYFSFKDQPDTSVDGSNLTSVSLTGDLKINLSPSGNGINPFFFGGLVFSILSISDSTYRIYGDTLVNRGAVSYVTRTGGLMELGGGLEFKNLFIQGRYIGIMSGKTSGYIPVTVGVKF